MNRAESSALQKGDTPLLPHSMSTECFLLFQFKHQFTLRQMYVLLHIYLHNSTVGR